VKGTVAAVVGILVAFVVGALFGVYGVPKLFPSAVGASGGTELTAAQKKVLVDQMALAIAANSGDLADKIVTEAQNKGTAQNALRIVADKARTAVPSNRPQRPVEEDPSKVYTVPVGDSYAKGPADAPVTIIAFSDYQCPYCGRGEKTMEEVEKTYGNKVRFVFKAKMLPFHTKAPLAHNAALAAGAQGKFWPMHEKIFSNQQSLERDTFIGYAKELGLNVAKFTADMDNAEKFKPFLDTEGKQADEIGIRGTPTFLVNGRMVRGAQPIDNFKKVIDEELAKKKG
jgi:protein-disulfide isomerase